MGYSRFASQLASLRIHSISFIKLKRRLWVVVGCARLKHYVVWGVVRSDAWHRIPTLFDSDDTRRISSVLSGRRSKQIGVWEFASEINKLTFPPRQEGRFTEKMTLRVIHLSCIALSSHTLRLIRKEPRNKYTERKERWIVLLGRSFLKIRRVSITKGRAIKGRSDGAGSGRSFPIIIEMD